MSISGIAGVALLSAFLILLLRQLRPEWITPVRVGALLLLFSAALLLYAPVVKEIGILLELCGGGEYTGLLLRALGIALIAEITAALCRDLGEGTVAGGVLLFGKLEILVLCLPLLGEVLTLAKELLGL